VQTPALKRKVQTVVLKRRVQTLSVKRRVLTLAPKRRVLALALKGRKLSITCYIEEDCARSRKTFRRRKKFRLLEEVLRMRVEVEVRHAETVEHV
jgi:hypothetical protein